MLQFDIYLLSDLERLTKSHHKVIIFLNTYWLTRTERRKIEKLKGKGRTLVFLYASGLVDEEEAGASNVSSLTGIRIKALKKTFPVEISIVKESHPIVKDLPKGFTFGCRQRKLSMPEWYPEKPAISPILFADDPRAIQLGKIAGTELVGFVVKEFNNWRSIWVGVNVLPASILRNICQLAGVHIYDYKEDIVYANPLWLVVHLSSDGERYIYLPNKMRVISALDGKIVGQGISSFPLRGKKGETFIFKLVALKPIKEGKKL